MNGLYKVVHGISIAAKICDLEWPLSEIQRHWFFKCNKNDEIQLMTPTPRRVAGWIISIKPTYSCTRALTYLLTQNNQRPLQLACDLVFRLFSVWLSFVPLPLVGPKIINVRYQLCFTAASRGLRCYCTPLLLNFTEGSQFHLLTYRNIFLSIVVCNFILL